MAVNRDLYKIYTELRGDLRKYASHCLKIRNKAGNEEWFKLNDEQLAFDAALNRQLERIGRVRMLVPKARQVGVSTYVGGRFYQKTTMNKGRRTFILTHEKPASDNLFEMVSRFHKHDPFAPEKEKDNARQLSFGKLDSLYTVATAGSTETGRSGTNNYFHGSEVAFWPGDTKHFASSVQTVPDERGTEIILESTANGVDGEYYNRVQDAIAGRGDYEYFFIPWFNRPEYARQPPPGFEISSEADGGLFTEREYMEMFNLTVEQMAWRRNKILELRSVMLFDQEYPGSIELAFQQKAEGAYHDAAAVMRARKRIVPAAGPLIMGVDPAGEGGDRFAIALRRGYVCEAVLWRDKIEHLEAVEWLKSLIDEHDPAVVFIDAGGIGKPVISTLRGKGQRYGIPHVRSVNFGTTSEFKMAKPKMPGPKNRRAEMQERLADWLKDEAGVSIPDLDVLQSDLMNIRIKPSFTNDLLLLSKQEMRALNIRSPDLADALGLTFASLVFIREFSERPGKPGFMQNEKSANVILPSANDIDDYGGSGGPGGWMI